MQHPEHLWPDVEMSRFPLLVSWLSVALGSSPEQGSPPAGGDPQVRRPGWERGWGEADLSGKRGLLVHPTLILPSICSLQGAPSRKPSVPGVILGPGGGGAQADHAQPAGPARLAVRLLGPAPSRSQLLVVSAGPEPFPAWLLWAMEVGRRGHSFIEPQNTRQLFLSLSSPRVNTAPRG